MKNLVSKFVKDESGATAIEYGLLAALIGIGIIAAVTGVRNSLNDQFDTIAETLDNAGPR